MATLNTYIFYCRVIDRFCSFLSRNSSVTKTFLFVLVYSIVVKGAASNQGDGIVPLQKYCLGDAVDADQKTLATTYSCLGLKRSASHPNVLSRTDFPKAHDIEIVSMHSWGQKEYRSGQPVFAGKYRLDLIYYFMCKPNDATYGCNQNSFTTEPLKKQIEVVAFYLNKCDISLENVQIVYFKATAEYTKLSLNGLYKLFEALPRFQRIPIYFVHSVNEELAPKKSGSGLYAGSILSDESPDPRLGGRVLITRKGYKVNAGGLIAHELMCHILPNSGPHSNQRTSLCYPLVPAQQKSVSNCESVIKFGTHSGRLLLN